MSNQAAKYISIEGAAKALNVYRTTVYYYIKLFSIKTESFPLDRRRYIALADLKKIQAAKEEAAARAASEINVT